MKNAGGPSSDPDEEPADFGYDSVVEEAWLRDDLSYFKKHLKIPACLNEQEHRRAIRS